jgi:hypothetical protein
MRTRQKKLPIVQSWQYQYQREKAKAIEAAKAQAAGASVDVKAATRFDPCLWIERKFGVTLWAGTEEKPGQREIANAYALSLRRQWERREFEAGRIAEQQLENYVPGTQVKNIIRVEAGHT